MVLGKQRIDSGGGGGSGGENAIVLGFQYCCVDE
jgi:hypothetical protein